MTPLGANTGVQFVNNGKIGILFNNGSGSPITVNEQLGRTVQGSQPPALPVSIPAGKTYLVSSFAVGDFLQPDGNTYLDVSSPTSVSAMAIQIPDAGQ
jgi:hypothetical protein